MRLGVPADAFGDGALRAALIAAAEAAGLDVTALDILATLPADGGDGSSGPTDIVFRAASPGAADALTEVLDSPAFRERLRDALSSGPTALEPTAGGAPLTVEAIPTATDDLATRPRTLSITGADEPSEAQIRAAVLEGLGSDIDAVGVEILGITTDPETGETAVTVRVVLADPDAVAAAEARPRRPPQRRIARANGETGPKDRRLPPCVWRWAQ